MKKMLRALGAIGALLCCLQAYGEVKRAEDVYGEYTFTAKIELTDAGKAAELDKVLKSECLAVIGKGEYYDVELTGLLGSTETQYGNRIDMETKTININNPNGGGWLFADQCLCMTLDDGVYRGAEIEYAFDAETGVISIPNFCLYEVTIDCFMGQGTPVLMAKITDAKMTPNNSGQHAAESDLTGEWTFVPEEGNGYATMPNSTLPTTYTLSLKSANDENSEYSAVLKIDGFEDVQLPNATFDGKLLSIAFDNVYLTSDIYLSDFQYGKSGIVSYQLKNDDVMNVYGALCLCNGVSFVQYYYMGTINRGAVVEKHDFTGTYRVTVGDNSFCFITDTDELPKPGQSFTFKVEMKENGEGDKEPCITEWMGTDTWTLTQGGTACDVVGNTLNIHTGVCYHRTALEDDGFTQTIELLADGNGLIDQPVTLTYNEADDTYTISDFGMLRTVRKYENWFKYEDVSNPAASNWYYGNTVKKIDEEDAIEGVQAHKKTDTRVFNINGQQVQKAGRGIYIIGGKKVAI
ncbi:MAG: hypothetical protein HUK00_08885 [Bacteroidaceae bacterium]|nr:hypothetical protein [Bacteroidaceae bacterium]